MKVIIAEKPSLAKNIAEAIGKMKKQNGYYENDTYFVTYAFGHLFRLYDIEMYPGQEKKEKKWTLEGLPFFPNPFRFGLMKDEGVIRQYKIIRSLINRDDVDEIINAGDSDREGEIIIRIILSYALSSKKKIGRLWMPDQTAKTILQELKEKRDDQDYDHLAREGYARTYIDWIYGINLTRFASIRSGTLLRVGRVIAPIVEEIYQREKEIERFVPRTYYVMTSKTIVNGKEIELVGKKEFETKELCQQAIPNYQGNPVTVSNVKKERKVIPSRKLFSLSKLQGEMGSKRKMSPEETLSIAQSLYEKGYISYPRTPAQFLAENEKGKIQEIIRNFQNLSIGIQMKYGKDIFDDSKVESHSALTPTYKIPKKSDLSEKESAVYSTIVHRFFAVFCKEELVIDRTTMEFTSKEENYSLSGEIVAKKGWTVFESREKKEQELPDLKVGDVIPTDFHELEKVTKPPKHYSVETLNRFLKNPFSNQKKVENDSDFDDTEYQAMLEGLELGTEATRAGIIAHAIESEYIILKDNVYLLGNKGSYYVETLQKLRILMGKKKTAELGKALRKIYRGEWSIEDGLHLAQKEVEEVFALDDHQPIPPAPRVFTVEKSKILCKCPKCGHPIAVTEKGFRCTFSGCGLSLYYDNPLFQKLNKKITKTMAKEIFQKGQVTLTGLTSKNQTTYDAILIADFSQKYIHFTFSFPNDQKKSST